MLAIKNRGGLTGVVFTGFLAIFLAACTPQGPRAFQKGREALEAGDYARAVSELTWASGFLSTNAEVWNYLGLACHKAGDAQRAAEAYQQALRLDRDLLEAHFNLGSLWLEQGRPDAAKSEFTIYTMRQADSFEAWLNLGLAQYRSGEAVAAEESFQKARRLNGNNPEVLNGLGLVSAQRRRPRDAVQYFNAALKAQPGYRPALLNLATVLRRDLGDHAGAAQRYREYVAQDPLAPEAATINAILQSLEAKPVATAPVVSPPPNLTVANVVKPQVTNQPPPPAVRTNPAVAEKVAPPKLIESPKPQTTTQAVVRTAAPNEVAKPVITAPTPTPTPTPPPTVTATAAPPVTAIAEPPPEKKSFLARLNPFRGGNNPPPKSDVVATGAETTATATRPVAAAARSFARYHYLAPSAPQAGNRAEAVAAMERGRQAEQAGKAAETLQAYRQAAQADPAYYEAQYRLGLVLYGQRDYTAALAAWENTLAIRPEATDARYNLALTLQAAGFVPDAAAELEKILAANPNDVRAHLIVGNLYAEQLRDKAQARVHYQRILELDSRHPQATAIRYWLVANPG